MPERPLDLVPESPAVVKSTQGRSLKDTATNDRKIRQAHKLLDQMMEKGLVRGFHGAVCLRVKVMDGTIQHVDQVLEQSHR